MVREGAVVASARSREARRFQRAAFQRLEEARFLLRGGYTTGSVYLGGYAVECVVKALILSSEPANRHATTLRSFRGRKGHDFDWLKHELYRRRTSLSERVIEALERVTWWDTDLRYDPAVTSLADAKAFM